MKHHSKRNKCNSGIWLLSMQKHFAIHHGVLVGITMAYLVGILQAVVEPAYARSGSLLYPTFITEVMTTQQLRFVSSEGENRLTYCLLCRTEYRCRRPSWGRQGAAWGPVLGGLERGSPFLWLQAYWRTNLVRNFLCKSFFFYANSRWMLYLSCLFHSNISLKLIGISTTPSLHAFI